MPNAVQGLTQEKHCIKVCYYFKDQNYEHLSTTLPNPFIYFLLPLQISNHWPVLQASLGRGYLSYVASVTTHPPSAAIHLYSLPSTAH